jgi:photosystem II stability/assembly factor-like uncharacterized protein
MLKKSFSPPILITLLCGILFNSVILAYAEWSHVQIKHDDLPVFKDIYFVDKQKGWVVGVSGFGEDGMVFHTKDGGVSWEQQELPANVKTLSRVFFVSPKVGWAVGQDGTIVATKNGGKDWDLQTSKVGNWLFDVFFINENVGWAVGDTGTIIKTTNGGERWNALYGGKPGSGVGEGEVMLDDQGYFAEGPAILQGVYFVDENTGWAVGQDGFILYTMDGGKKWKQQVSNSESVLYSVSFIDANTGCAVGEDGSIVRTTDGGTTWQSHQGGGDPNLLEKLFRVSFAPKSQEGWAVGTGGTILQTTDGGENWEQQEKLSYEIKIPGANPVVKKFSQELTSVFVIDREHCWVVGQDWVFKYTK